MWNEEEKGQRYPNFIKESQAAYKTPEDPALGRLFSKKQGEYTVEDYYALPDECRAELIDGVIYDMAAPDYIHQVIAFQIAVQLDAWIKKKKGSCMVIVSPADVRLDKDDKMYLSYVEKRIQIRMERIRGRKKTRRKKARRSMRFGERRIWQLKYCPHPAIKRTGLLNIENIKRPE